MTLTRPQLRLLRIVSAIAAVASAVVLVVVYSATRGGPVGVERWQVGVMALPWLVFVAAFLPLVHHAWFSGEQKPLMRAILRVFFWFFAACWIAVFAGIYGGFVFT